VIVLNRMSYTSKHLALRIVVAIPIVSILLVGCWFIARVAVADYLSRKDSLAERTRAAEMFPSNAAFHLRLAAVEMKTHQDPRPELLRAAADSPADAHTWLTLGLESERRRDVQTAGRQLLKAAQLSALFEPKDALAKYYFGRHDTAQARYWVREAMR